MYLVTTEKIKQNSNALNELHRRMMSTAGAHTPAHLENCREFHAHFDELAFPGVDAMYALVNSGNKIAVENAVRFLVSDPIHFRSGYIKENLWRWLKHSQLATSKVERLERAALSYLDRRTSREFWYMAKAMHKIASPSFWLEVTNISEQAATPKRLRATYLLAHGVSLHTGAMLRRQLHRRWLREQWSGSQQFVQAEPASRSRRWRYD